MGLRHIRQYGDEILRKTAKPVAAINAGTHALLDDMLETLRDKDGVGLAAPQVGVLRRIVVVEWEENVYELINPVIVTEKGSQRCNEACLSVAGKQGDVERPRHVTVEALDRDGNTCTVMGDEFLASVLCHELDHLDGVLYIDKAFSVTDRKKSE
jgi:peptide deformylase